MLAQLSIENLVVIEQACVEFDRGLNVLTGQTGAGKSLLIGAIEALLGLRPAKDLLRAGQNEGRITGLFCLQDPVSQTIAARLLDEPDPLAEILISRRIARTRTTATVNNRPVTAAILRELTEILIDIHGQHEHQYLLKPANQIHVLTTYANAQDLADATSQSWQCWQHLQRLADDLATNQKNRIQTLDFYRFQIDEIDTVAPEAEEFASLRGEHKKLANLERLRQAAGQAADAISAESTSLRQAAAALADMAKMDPETAPLQQACDEALAGLNELDIDLARYVDSLETDSGRLEFVESRIEQIQRLCRKYGPNVEDVIEHRRKIGEEMKLLEDAESNMGQLKAQIDAARQAYMNVAGKLTQRRRAASQKLSKAVMTQTRGTWHGKGCVQDRTG